MKVFKSFHTIHSLILIDPCKQELVSIMLQYCLLPPSLDPTPGGCTLVSPLDVDPNLALSYTQFTTKLIFQPGNAAFNPVIGQIEPDCTASRPGSSTSNVNSIRYQVYRHFLSWRGASEDDMFSAIESMLSADNLTKSVSAITHTTMKWVMSHFHYFMHALACPS